MNSYAFDLVWVLTAVSFRQGMSEHFAGVLDYGGCDICAANHARYFSDTLCVIERNDRNGSAIFVHLFFDIEMPIGT